MTAWATKILKMLRSIFSRAWGRGKVTLVTVVMALSLALISPALAATGGNFILGRANTATDPSGTDTGITQLKAKIANPAMKLINTSMSTGATALNLTTASTQPPMTVNSATKVDNLNSDKLDGQDSSAFAPKAVENWHEVGEVGEPPFNASWQNFDSSHNSAGFYKDPFGVVHLKGLVKRVTPATAGPVGCDLNERVFSLPSGYTPSTGRTTIFTSAASLTSAGGETTLRVNVHNEAIWVCESNPSKQWQADDWLSLDGISFRAATEP
jgi:hypothetical protein